jgi:predicted amidohydrolase
MTTIPSQRLLTVAAAQLGPIKSLDSPRSEALTRMIALCEEAKLKTVRLVVFPELAFTTFFPGYIIEKQEDLDKFFESASPQDPYTIIHSPNGKPLFDKAADLGIDICVGYGERWTAEDGRITYYNTAIYYSAIQRRGIAKYRKIHLPGRHEPDTRPGVTQQLEKRYFAVGNLGFEAFRVPDLLPNAVKSKDATSMEDTQGHGDPILGMLLCNDRRWAEGWRSYGLQGVELVLVSCLSASTFKPIPR